MRRVRGVSLGVLATVAVLGARDVSAQFFVPGAATGFDTAVVSVMGTAQVFVDPDHAVLFVQIVTREDSPEAAALANGETRSRVMETLLGLGYAEEDVGLWGYGAAPSPMRGYGGPPDAGASGGYEAKSGIRVRVEPIGRLDAVASSLHLAGASVSTVVLESHQSDSARREAARLAVSNARAKAEAMAEAAGGRLGTLLRVLTLPDYAQTSTSRWSAYPGGPGPEGVNLTPTDVTMSVTVQATWAFVAR